MKRKSLFLFKIICLNFILLFFACKKADERGYVVKVGEMAPDFEMVFTDGQMLKLSDMRGKIVMLQFTASWCGVCRKEMPFIEKEIWQIQKNKNFVLFGIDREEPVEKVKDFAQSTGITYPLALDPHSKIFTKFAHEKAGVTRNVIIDKNGKIVFLSRLFERKEFDEMKEIISSLLKK